MFRIIRLTALLSIVFMFAAITEAQTVVDPTTSWLTDEQAREVAGAAIHSTYPEPCYSTYRQERLESFLTSLRENRIVGNQVNRSVYFYRVANDSCEYVTEKDGKPILMFQVSMDCCEYGIVAVDRSSRKSYWFADDRAKASKIFGEFVRDEQLRPDSPKPLLFTSLYFELVAGDDKNSEITSLSQLQDLVEENFRSAYSPYERDNVWQRKFDVWWQKFRSKMKDLKLDTAYQITSDGTLVRGFGFEGFRLTIPRSDPPPKGTPELFQWSLLIKSDGTVEYRPRRVIYSSR